MEIKSYNLLIAQTIQALNNQDFETALAKAQEAISQNRLNLQANYLAAQAYYHTKHWIESYKYYSILFTLQNQYHETVVAEDKLLSVLDDVTQKAIDELSSLPANECVSYQKQLLAVNAAEYNLNENMFYANREIENYFGLHTFFDKEYYIGRYDNWYHSYSHPENAQNGLNCKAEIYEVCAQSTEFMIDNNLPCILPVVVNPESTLNTLHIKTASGKDISYFDTIIKTFSYYRITEPVQINAEQPMIFGKPIPLVHHPDNKKLVLNIFFDSFNWKFIKDSSLEELMPNTYHFFKDGIICDNFYTGSEFTYPSVASYWTGLRSTNHSVLNQNLQFPIPEEFPLFSEIFQDKGYVTAKIGGNDSVVPNYGYIRGIDRFVYEKSEQNFHVQDTVHETIEHLEAFQEADSFLWVELQDLHEVSGYWKMPLSVQAKTPVECNQIDNEGGSSLYQTPSAHRRFIYKEQLKHMDQKLHELYDYISNHYDKNEVLVTLISDHGNAFNVDAGQPFMSDQRTNVPLMIYGAGDYESACHEKIETIDYGHILCKLAGIQDQRLAYNDGQLPAFFGGGREKPYVFSQSLFPERNYAASIITDDYKFYFQSKNLVSNDCRINISDGMYCLVDKKTELLLTDPVIAEKCLLLMQETLGSYLDN